MSRGTLFNLERGKHLPHWPTVTRLLDAYSLRLVFVPQQTRLGQPTPEPGPRLVALLDRPWRQVAHKVRELEEGLTEPNAHRWPYSTMTAWAMRRRDATRRRRNWLEARLEALERLREKADELEAALRKELRQTPTEMESAVHRFFALHGLD